jgi:NodT family efflux transporter outer membrane factor (OMF) lipoprotein
MSKRLHSTAIALSALGFLAGCMTVGPDFQEPKATTAGAYDRPADNATGPRATLGAGPTLQWWEAFGSPEMNQFVDQAIAGNYSLAESTATLERARERIKAVAGRQLPQVDANARVEHQQVNLSAFGLDPSAFGGSIGNPEFELYSVGGGISYDLDLFGGNRRATERAVADAEAQLHETEAAHLTIAGRVVLQVLTIAALNDRIATDLRLLEEDRRNVDLTRARQRAGGGTLVEVLSAEGQLANDQGDIPELEQLRDEARNMLAILLGVSPAQLGPTDFTLASMHLPAEVPVSLPSELVHKRPDILASEAQLHSATAAIGIATARLYPDITLGASLEQAATHPGDIFNSASTGFDIFAGLTAPIFHGGTLKAEKRGAEAEARAAAARYQQTVLEAFGQVSNLLTALSSDAQSVSYRQQAVDVAGRSLQLSRRSFQVGNSGILQVLDASRTEQHAQLALVNARSAQLLNVARLYVATAGGWTGPAQVAASGSTPPSP